MCGRLPRVAWDKNCIRCIGMNVHRIISTGACLLAFGGGAVSALEFAPHPCGDGIGAPISASHVTVLTDHVVFYRTFHDEFILLNCEDKQAVVVPDPLMGSEKYETWQFEPAGQERRAISRQEVCGATPVSMESVSAKMKMHGYESSVRGMGRAEPRPFVCVCDVQVKGGHGAMAGVLSFNSNTVLPEAEKGCS